MIPINKNLITIGKNLKRIEEELIKINTREDAKLEPKEPEEPSP